MTLLRSLVLVGFTVCASVAFGATQQVGDEFLLQTKNTTMAFRKSEGSWLMIHYGAKIENAADASALAWSRWQGGNSLGDPKPASYSVYGSDNDASDMNKFGGLAVTHADGVVSTELKSVDAKIVPDQAGITHLEIEFKDAVYPFYVTQHFRAIAASDVIETWVELRHTETAPVKVVRMDSAALTFPLLAKNYSVMTLAGQWASENQIAEAPIAKGQTVSMTSRSGVHSAFGNNPSFMLSVGPTATETTGRVIGGTLAWSGAWNITLQHDQVDDLFVYAGVDTGNGAYVLDPGKTLVTPKLALTFSATGKGQVSRNFHRWARDVQLRDGHASRPILLNSWEGAYFNFTEKTLTDMMDGVKELGGEMFVVDDGWFARGKYARDDDKRGLGDWVVNEEKLPRGLGALANEATQRGLKFGIWVEPEMANTTSELAEQHPEWILREKTRPLRQGRGGTQVVLDMTNPAVRDNIFGQMDAMIASMPDLAYIKWDANADFMNAGSAFLGADRQANLWYDYTDGLYNLLGRLHDKYPKLAIQACSSGGGHMDYGFLHYADEFWTSDDTDARQRVFIQWGASQFFPAVAMSAHVTVSPNQYTGRATPLKFRFDVAMSGRLGFELQPKNMSADDVAFSKKAVVDYKRILPVVQQGNLYRLVSPWENTYASLMYVNDEQTHAVVFVYGLNRFVQADYASPLRLQGLDPARHYRVAEIDASRTEHSRVNGKTLDGASLEAMGLPVKLEGDYDSAVFELTAD